MVKVGLVRIDDNVVTFMISYISVLIIVIMITLRFIVRITIRK